MIISQKIAASLTVWTAVWVVIVGSHDIELFGILMLIGLLITRELTTSYTDQETGVKMDALISIGIILFVVVISHRVLSILGIF